MIVRLYRLFLEWVAIEDDMPPMPDANVMGRF